MPEPSPDTILHRMIGARPDPFLLDEMSPAKALRLAVARAAEEGAHMVAALTGFDEERIGKELLLESWDECALVFTLAGPSGPRGIAIADTGVLSSVIEQLLTGRITRREAEARAPTPTDAAVVRDLLNRVLNRFDTEMAVAEQPPPVTGFRLGAVIFDARAASMMLEEIDYRSYRATIDFAEGARTGALVLVFPWSAAGAAPVPASAGAAWRRNWKKVLSKAEVELEAVLYRLTMPLAKLNTLEAGMVLPLPVEAIDKVSLEGGNGHRVASARLGQVNGMRALRLHLHDDGRPLAGPDKPVHHEQMLESPENLPPPTSDHDRAEQVAAVAPGASPAPGVGQDAPQDAPLETLADTAV